MDIELNNSFWKSKLGKIILLYVLISLVTSLISIVVLQKAFEIGIDTYLEKSDFMSLKTQETINDFQNYIDDRKLSSMDKPETFDWLRNEKSVMFYIFADGKYVNSTDDPLNGYYSEVTEHFRYVIHEQEIRFSDVTATATVINISSEKYYNISKIVSGGLAFLLFVMMLLKLIAHKISYINEIENEIKILEGGSLEYQISIKGDDEITSLAKSLEEMRLSFVEKLSDKSVENKANKHFVASLTHDLRTPLTTLIGYLDMIEDKKFNDDAQLFSYVHKAREKAYQIKTMSDRLFSYSLNDEKKVDIELQEFSGNEAIGQMIEEYAFLLKNKDFDINIDYLDVEYTIYTNIELLYRIFDNAFLNILKYADNKDVVEIKVSIEGKTLKIEFRNRKDIKKSGTESSKLGLNNIERLMQNLNGKMEVEQVDGYFILNIYLPTEAN